MRRILITNDDSCKADGIIRLAQAATKFGEVWLVAPDSQRSACSHSLTLRDSIEAWKVDFPIKGVHAYACNGTPADCVRIGVLNIVPGRPTNVFSGINYGYNLATDIQYSGTAGAAFEASFLGIHSIAFSENSSEIHETTDQYLSSVMEELLQMPLAKYEIWNVNFPGCKKEECKGLLRNRVVSSDVFYQDVYYETTKEDGTVSYRLEGIRRKEAELGTDLRAIYDNFVSIGRVKNIS